MASIRGFSATVEGIDGSPFRTYGTRSRGNILYTNIEAKDGVCFQVRVKPDSPFPEPRDESIGGEHRTSRYALRSSKRQDAQDAMDCTESDAKPKRPWDFFCYLFLDGNSKFEDSVLIATEPGPEYYSPKGQVFKGRCHEVAKGDDRLSDNSSDSDMRTTFQVNRWYFRDKGVDVWLGHMDLSKDNAELPATDLEQDVADITEAIADDRLSKGANRKRGRIEIVIKREVQEKEIRPKKRSKPEPRENLGDDDGSTHEIIVDENNKQYHRSTMVRTHQFDPDEEFFCKISIAYLDIAKLRNLGLCTQDGTPIARRQQRVLASSSGAESPTPLLKRLRDLDIRKSDNTIGDSMLSDEESASSDSTSDSDVPRQRKRRAIPGIRKAKPRKRINKTLPWRVQQAADNQSIAVIESSGMSLRDLDLDLKYEVSQRVQLGLQAANEGFDVSGSQLQLAIADTERGPDGSAAGNELVVASNEVVEMTDGEEIS